MSANLHKQNHIIEGEGYQCQIEDIHVTTSTSFINTKTLIRKTYMRELAPQDCRYMAYTKRCMG